MSKSATDATAEISLVEGKSIFESSFPDWIKQKKSDAWQEYLSLSDPKRKDEKWRFSNVHFADVSRFCPASQISDEDVAAVILTQSCALENPSARFLFANNELAADPILDPRLADQGVVILPFDRAAKEYNEMLQKHLFQFESQLGGQKLDALHRSQFGSGVFVYVPKGVVVERPIEIYHWAQGEGSSIFPHLLVVAGEHSQVSVVEFFQSINERDATFSCGNASLISEKGAKIEYAGIQDWNEKSRHYQATTVGLSQDSHIIHFLLNLGSEWCRNETVSHVHGKGAKSDLLAAAVVDNLQEIDSRTLQLHEEPNTMSDLLYKNALFHQAKSIFSGLILVQEGAHYTDAYQKCRNLLLSEDAEANSMPGLEINADQVRCSHGSTSGPIRDEELFYLLARGISDKKARQLVTFGFLNEVLERFPNAEVREVIEKMIFDQLDRLV